MKTRKQIVACILILVCISCASKIETIKEGDQAPLFIAEDFSGRSFNLKDYEGRNLLIHFWADWCSECRAEFPKLERTYQKQLPNNFEILAINVAQDRTHVEAFAKEFKLTFPMLLDEHSETAKKYGIRGLPTNYFINPDLTIAKIIIGWVDEKQIEQVLKK